MITGSSTWLAGLPKLQKWPLYVLEITVDGITYLITSFIPTKTGTTFPSPYPTVVYYDDAEIPSDTGDHQNFTLLGTPNPTTSLKVFINGLIRIRGVDYTLSGNTITLGRALSGTWSIVVSYRRPGTGGSTVNFVDSIIPSDTGDHQNFNLPSAPYPTASLELYVNGQYRLQGTDYALSGTLVTLNAPLVGTWSIVAFYRTA